MTAGTISPSLGHMISTSAQQMVTDVVTGKSAQAISEFQQTTMSIAPAASTVAPIHRERT